MRVCHCFFNFILIVYPVQAMCLLYLIKMVMVQSISVNLYQLSVLSAKVIWIVHSSFRLQRKSLEQSQLRNQRGEPIKYEKVDKVTKRISTLVLLKYVLFCQHIFHLQIGYITRWTCQFRRSSEVYGYSGKSFVCSFVIIMLDGIFTSFCFSEKIDR